MNTRATRRATLETLLTEAFDRSFEPYKKDLRVGQVVRLRAAALRGAAEALRAFADGRGRECALPTAVGPETVGDLRFMTALLEKRLEAELDA